MIVGPVPKVKKFVDNGVILEFIFGGCEILRERDDAIVRARSPITNSSSAATLVGVTPLDMSTMTRSLRRASCREPKLRLDA